MATKKLSDLTALTTADDADTLLISDASEALDIDKSKYITAANLKSYISGALTTAMALIDGVGITPQLRLSLVSGNPISLTDSSSVGTVYYTPYNGSAIQLYNGSNWEVFALSELSLSLTATQDKNYDIFIDYNAGTPQMVLGTAWTNDTTRADALAYQNGRLVKSGTAAYLYVGTIRANGTNTTIDTEALRYVYNYYNRIRKGSVIGDSEAKSVGFVLGVEEYVSASYQAQLGNYDGEGNASGYLGVALKLDSSDKSYLTINWPDDTVRYETRITTYMIDKCIGEHVISAATDGGSAEGMTVWPTGDKLFVDLWM